MDSNYDSNDNKYSKKYAMRSFGHLKDKALTSLGSTGKTSIFTMILIVLAIIPFLIWVMYHPVYLKTGTPMFKWGLAISLLQPFYFLWAILKIVSVYLLKMSP